MRRVDFLIGKLHSNVNGMSELNMKCLMKLEGRIDYSISSYFFVKQLITRLKKFLYYFTF